jgi:hypothetical protein
MINEMTDQFIKYLVKPQFEQKFPDGDMSGISITLNDASNIAVQTAVSSFTLLADMGWLLVAANESDEFITGDTPVIFANPFLKQVNGLSNTGLTTKGLLVILPLSPRLALILFDKAVYRLHGKQTQPTFTFATSKDIEQLNILQAALVMKTFTSLVLISMQMAFLLEQNDTVVVRKAFSRYFQTWKTSASTEKYF